MAPITTPTNMSFDKIPSYVEAWEAIDEQILKDTFAKRHEIHAKMYNGIETEEGVTEKFKIDEVAKIEPTLGLNQLKMAK